MEGSVSFAKSMFLLAISAATVLGGIIVLDAEASIVLVSAGTVVIALSMLWGIRWERIQEGILDTLRSMFPAILILLAVGMLVGTWMLSGTVPLMIYYGLQILNPVIFLPAVALVCAVMSVMAGTSWGTISTVGVAMMGVSAGLGVPLYYTAGAIVVGAIFGDKLSPLSDTTVLASGVSGVNIIDHIKYMLYTTIPGFVISLVLYVALGMRFTEGAASTERVRTILSTLDATFNLNPILLLPPVVILFLIFYKKTPVLPVFGIGIILGGILALLFQGHDLSELAAALNDGYASSTGVGVVDEMLTQGGLTSMLEVTALLISAAVFGAPLRTAGVIDALLEKVQRAANTGRGILLSGFSVHGLLFVITGSYYVTFSVLGPVLGPLYDRYGLDRRNLSRTMEDTGTSFAPMIPWGTTGAFIVATLGVPTFRYILYAPMTYLALVFALFYIITGIRIARVPPEGAAPESVPPQEERPAARSTMTKR